MLFQQKGREFAADGDRHLFAFRKCDQFLLALAAEHPFKSGLRSLLPAFPKLLRLAVHGVLLPRDF